MHTNTDTITPSEHLPAVEALLKQLDQMRGKVGSRQRLEFLLERGPRVVRGFDIEDAFGLSRKAHTDRVQKLEDLGTAMDVLRAHWQGDVLEDGVKKAGDRLIGHLAEFVRQAKDTESRFEVGMLESVWESSPNVFPAFGLPTPFYYSENAENSDDFVEEIRKRFVESYTPENSPESESAPEPATMSEDPTEGIPVSSIQRTAEELDHHQVHVPLKVGGEMKVFESSYEVVHTLSSPDAAKRYTEVVLKKPHPVAAPAVGKSLEEPEETPPQEALLEQKLDMLEVKCWTEAIHEVLASSWTFSRQLQGRVGDRARMGLALFWTKGKETLRLDIERLGVDEVLVRMTPPRISVDDAGRYQVYAKEMQDSALAELHKSPEEFVKHILRPS